MERRSTERLLLNYDRAPHAARGGAVDRAVKVVGAGCRELTLIGARSRSIETSTCPAAYTECGRGSSESDVVIGARIIVPGHRGVRGHRPTGRCERSVGHADRIGWTDPAATTATTAAPAPTRIRVSSTSAARGSKPKH